MTTIAEFLKQTSGNNSEVLYKEAGIFDFLQQGLNTTKGVVQSGIEKAKEFGESAGEFVSDLNKSYNLNEGTNANDLYQKYVPMQTFNNIAHGVLSSDPYKPYLPMYNALSQNKDFQQTLYNTVRDTIFKHYNHGSPWTREQFMAMDNDFSDPNNIQWPEGLQEQIMTNVMDAFNNQLSGYTQQNLPDNVAEAFYNTMYDYMPDSPNKTALTNTVGNDLARRRDIGRTMYPHIQSFIQQKGLTGFADQIQREELVKQLTPQIQNLVQGYGVNDYDAIPDSSNATGSEAEGYATGLYGQGHTPLKGMMNPYYDSKNPNKTNWALFGAINQFLDPNLGLIMVDNYSQLDPSERGNSGLATTLAGFEGLATRFGLADDAAEIKAIREGLSAGIGQKGSRWMTSAQLYEEAQKKVQALKEKLDQQFAENTQYKRYMGNPYNLAYNDEKERQAAMTYAQEAAQQIRNNPWDDGYYGLLSNENVRRAVQYASPWLMYGLPLAGLGSLLGTNSLWPLVLFGGLGSGVLGYGAKDWFKMNPDTVQGMDNFFGGINKPLGALGSLLLSKSMSGELSSLLSGPQSTQEKPVTESPAEQPSSQDITSYNYENPALQYSPEEVAYQNAYDPRAISYINYAFNPGQVRAQRLSGYTRMG